MQGCGTLVIAIGLLVLGLTVATRIFLGGPGTSASPGCAWALLHTVSNAVWSLFNVAILLYKRSFIVFTEFVSGVHDWPSYRTSSFKYLGALSAFVGWNGVLFAIPALIGWSLVSETQGPVEVARSADLALAVHFGGTAIGLASARFLLRRMP